MNRDQINEILFKLAQDMTPVANARIAAAIVLKGRIVSFGFNTYKTHPLAKLYSKNAFSVSLHAELMAIKNALKVVTPLDLERCSLYVVRVKYTDKTKTQETTGLAKPCSGCAKAILAFNLREVIYSADKDQKWLI
jgi:tRNA(Arg) A34 adenosine deaminase TadA